MARKKTAKAVKKISSSPDRAKTRADKKDAKRSAKALKAVNKPAKKASSNMGMWRQAEREQRKSDAREAAKKRALAKAPNQRSAAENLAIKRDVRGKVMGGGLGSGPFGPRVR